MNFNELTSALQTGESGGNFTFDPANSAFAGADWLPVRTIVTGNIGSAANAGKLVIQSFQKSSTATTITYSGSVAALLPQMDPAFTQVALTVSAVFWLIDGVAELVAGNAALPASWTVPQSVSGTEESVLDDVSFTTAALTIASVDGNDPVTGNPIALGTSFTGTVALAGLFAPVAPLLAPSNLAVTGMMTLASGQYPRFNFVAPGAGDTLMAPFPFSLSIGVYVSSVVEMLQSGTTEEPYQFLGAGLVGTIFLGSGEGRIVIPVQMPLASTESQPVSFLITGVSIPFPSWEAFAPLTGVANLGALLPADVPSAGALVLKRLFITVDPNTPTAFAQSISLDIAMQPGQPWQIIPNGILSIVDLGVQFTINGSGAATDVTTLPQAMIDGAMLYGTFRFGTENPVDYGLTVTVPQLEVAGALANGTTIPLSSLVAQFITTITGGAWQLPVPNMVVSQLDLYASPRTQQYSIEAQIDTGWSLVFPGITTSFDGLYFQVAYDGAVIAGMIEGYFTITTAHNETQLFGLAQTDGHGNWALAAGTTPGSVIDLTGILTDLLSFAVDLTSYNLPTLDITDVRAAIGIAPSGTNSSYIATYRFGARTNGLWTFSIGSYDFGVGAALDLSASRSSASGPWQSSGTLAGTVAINNFSVILTYQFTPQNWSLVFQILWKGKGITATYSEKAVSLPAPHKESILRISIGDLSFGDIVAWLVSLARPGEEVTLSAPWSILYQISFKNLSLIANLTTSTVGIRYEPHLDLGFVSVDAIGLTYITNASGRGSVQVSIEGKFLGKPYGQDDPLAWDLLDEAPPSVPGMGEEVIDIRYVALGQRIGVPAAANAETIREALAALKTSMKEVSGATNPLLQPGGEALQYDASSSILFAVEAALIGKTVTLGVVLWDPYLYGVWVALAGKRAGSLAGLEFELLYKKVTNDIGVFRIELRVPEAFRQLEFGEVSITLGVVKVDIYTNGNFRVDLGFPRNGDFTDSFCLQVFPFIGFGGLYLAVLNGQTSTTVPKITNGTFHPVIEAGLGLSVGVGKEIRKGALEAGLSITVFAIIEGTLAWFNPTSSSTPDAMYYRLQGTAGIVGKLFGTVDFYVVKVSVSVVARASVTLVIEAYEPILVELELSVTVDAEVKILFVKISFSFSATLDMSFTIGSRSTPPWLLAPDSAQPAQQARMLSTHRRARRESQRRRRARALSPRAGWRRRSARVARTEGESSGLLTLDWSQRQVFATPKTVPLTMMPLFSVALPSTVAPFDGSGDEPSGDDDPVVRGVMFLAAENTVAVDAQDADAAARVSIEHLAFVSDPSEAPFSILVEATLRWAIAAGFGTGATSISLVDLAEILRAMDNDGTTESSGFSYASITAFIGDNLVLQIAGPPTSGSPSDTSATIFPMIPELTMSAPNLPGTVNFATYQTVDDAYVAGIQTYFEQLMVDALAGVARDPFVPQSAPRRQLRMLGEGSQSLATVIFRDWFLILTKSSVQAALDLMEKWPYEVQSGDSLQSIANGFSREQLTYICVPGDTISSVAALFGMTAGALRELNHLPPAQELTTPGEPLVVTAGVGPETIAVANQASKVLNTATALPIDGVLVQVQTIDGATQTLSEIATSLGIASQLGAIGTANALARDILAAGADLIVPSFTHAAQSGDNLPFLAAFYTARNGGVADSEALGWYTQAVFELNPAADFTQPFAAGVTLSVPSAYQAQSNGQPASQPYTTRAGDTQDFIAAYFYLVQKNPGAIAQLETSIQAANPNVNFDNLTPGESIVIPAIEHAIEAGESLSSIAARFTLPGLSTDQVTAAGLATNNGSAVILAPLAVLTMPRITHTPAATEDLATIAAYYNLSIDELAESIAATANVFLTTIEVDNEPQPVVLTIPAVPVTTIDTLVARLLNTTGVNTIASSVSRFTAAGLRLPDPHSEELLSTDVVCYGMADLAGQEFNAPPASAGATISFDTSGVSWITFVTTEVTNEGDTLSSVEARHPGTARRYARPHDEALRAGTRVVVGDTAALTITLTSAQLTSMYPSTTLTPGWIEQPQPLPVANEHPVQTSLQSVIHWQAAVRPPFAGPAPANAAPAGEPGLWTFPAPLLEQAISNSSTPFELVTLARGANAQPQNVAQYEWGTLLPFRVKTLGGKADSASASYVFAGADQASRLLLLEAWQWLSTQTDKNAAQLFILYPPSGDSANPQGLASDAVNLTSTYLLKANLTTDTTSGEEERAPAGIDEDDTLEGNYYAGLDAPFAFLQLMWEAAITGTGGYVLGYTNGNGTGLPTTAFSQGGEATLWLLILMNAQTAAANPARRLYPFNNVAVVGDNVDPAAVNLFAQASDGSQQTKVAAFAPGNAGFAASMTNPVPAPPNPPTPEQLTQELFSFFGYAVQTAGNFTASNSALPTGPSRPEDTNDPAVWSYTQVFAIAPLATQHDAPLSPALPAPANDPYAGIAPDSEVTIAFNFVDVFGNETAPTPAVPTLPIPVGYTDDVIGLAAWPGLAISYEVVSGPSIAMSVALRSNTYVPGVGNDYATAVAAAASHVARYQSLWYQLQQPTMHVSLTTSLDQAAQSAPHEYALQKYWLTDIANGSFAFLNAASYLTQPEYTTAAGDKLGTVASAWALESATLLRTNRELLATSVFATGATVPVNVAVAFGDTLASIAAAANLAVDALVALGDNALIPIAAGTDVVIPSQTITPAAGQTLASLAAAAQCTVGDLAVTNAGTPSLFNDSVPVTLQGVTVLTTATSSLNDLVTAFAAQFVSATPAQIAAANELTTTLLAQVPWTYVNRLLPEPTTLTALATTWSTTLSVVAAANANVVNLYPTGAPLLTGTTTVVPVEGETVGSFAEERNRISVDELASFNTNTVLGTGTTLRIPLQASLATSPAPYVPSPVRTGQNLASVSALFAGTTADSVAADNQYLIGTIAGGQSITVDGKAVTTIDGDSMASVRARFQTQWGLTVTLPQLVTAIDASSAQILRAGSVFVVPAPSAAASATPASAALAQAISLELWANTNAALAPLIAPGPTLTLGGKQVQILAQDTLAKIVTRFAAQGVATTVTEVASQSQVALVTNARYLIPPQPVAFAQQLRSGSAFPATLFPIEVDLTLWRDQNCILHELADVESVAKSASAIPPLTDASTGASLSLTGFATSLENAYSGNVKAASSRGLNATGEEVRQVWAVNFGTGGITNVTLNAAETAFFAFEPLSTQLESPAGVMIRPYTSGQGLGTAVPVDFQSVDLETWMRSFLRGVDLVLSPAYAAPFFSVPAIGGADPAPHHYFDDVVGYKGTIAGGVSQKVTQVLAAPAPQGDVAAAREAMRQKLLIELSTAYATDVLVQMPSSVDAALPATSGTRLSGKPRSIVYTTGNADGFTQLADAYAVSSNWIALALQNMIGILTGQTVTYTPSGGGAPVTYAVQASDTLSVVAKAVGAPDVTTLVTTLTWPAGSGLFRPATAIPASSFAIAIPSGATFGTLSDYFGVASESFSIANELVANIFSATSLTIGGTTIQITAANNSIAGAAASFTAAGLPMTPALLGGALRDQTGVLATGVIVTVMPLIPDFSMSVAKVTLSAPSSSVNFLFSTPQARDFRTLWLDLDYVINELEYGIVPVSGVTGYEASSWLSFIVPIGGSHDSTPPSLHTTLGALRIPIPLRTYPSPAILSGQRSTPPPAPPQTVSDATLWDYGFTYQYEQAAQDTLSLTVRFNETPTAALAGGAQSDQLFAPLAQFATAWPQLEKDLTLLLDPNLAENPANLQIARVAVQTMTTIVKGVAAVYEPSVEMELAEATPPAGQIFTYDARITFADGEYSTYILTATSSNGKGPGGRWPQVWWIDENGMRHQLTLASEGATTAVYDYAPGVIATRRISHELRYTSLGILTQQSGRSGLQVTRNRELLLPPSTTQTAPQTSPGFVYQTPELDFANRLIPLIAHDEPIGIRVSGNLTTDLTTMFTALLGGSGDGDYLTVSVEYGYALVTPDGGGTPIISRLPVLFRPTFAFVSSGADATVTTLVAAINTWAGKQTLPETGALYVFNVSLFSTLDTALRRPLLTVSNMQWPLS